MEEAALIYQDFERYLKLRNVKTYEQYLIYLKDFLVYLKDKELDYRLLKPLTIENYRSYLLTEVNSNARNTINNRLSKIKRFYAYLLLKKAVGASPFDNYFKGLKRGTLLPKNILSVEETGKLLDNFSEQSARDVMVKSMIELLYGSALRVSELAPLKLADIDFERGYLTVTNVKEGGERNRLPATDLSLRALKRYLKHYRPQLLSPAELAAGYLYPQRKEVANKGLINRKLKKECLRLGIKEISSHAFRHGCDPHATLRSRYPGTAGLLKAQTYYQHGDLYACGEG